MKVVEAVRPTKMLKFEEVREDLGVSPTQLINLVRLGFLHPIKLGMGNKFSQADILEFQEKYKGQDLSNGAKLLKIKELERKKGTAPTVPDKNQPSSL